MTTQPLVISIICRECGRTFSPYGDKLVTPPAYLKKICPYCKTENFVYYDEELRREIARRELNLDSQLGIKELESENKMLKAEVESLNKRIDGMEKEIAVIKEAVNSLIPAVREQVAEAIANMLQQPTKEKIHLAR